MKKLMKVWVFREKGTTNEFLMRGQPVGTPMMFSDKDSARNYQSEGSNQWPGLPNHEVIQATLQLQFEAN